MPRETTPEERVQSAIWSVDFYANKVKRAENEKDARKWMHALRKKVDELENRVLAELRAASTTAGGATDG